MPINSSRADRLAEIAGTDAPATLGTWSGQNQGLNTGLNSLQSERASTSEQLKVYLEENLRLKVSSEQLKDELEQKRGELLNRANEASERKVEVTACFQDNMLSAYLESIKSRSIFHLHTAMYISHVCMFVALFALLTADWPGRCP